VKMWFVYDARMKTLEAERRRGTTAHQQESPTDGPNR